MALYGLGHRMDKVDEVDMVVVVVVHKVALVPVVHPYLVRAAHLQDLLNFPCHTRSSHSIASSYI